MHYQDYLSTYQDIVSMYQGLIYQALGEGNTVHRQILVKERDQKLDELRNKYFILEESQNEK